MAEMIAKCAPYRGPVWDLSTVAAQLERTAQAREGAAALVSRSAGQLASCAAPRASRQGLLSGTSIVVGASPEEIVRQAPALPPARAGGPIHS